MKKVIYYFSGTGNSLRVATKIAERLKNTEIISVRCVPNDVSAKNADVIGFVCPVYEWDIPGKMKEFIMQLDINPNAYIFMVVTYIAIHGKAFETVESLLSDKGGHLNYGKALRCVASQCTAYPPFPPKRIMIPYMEKNIRKVCKDICSKKTCRFPHMSAITKKLYPRLMVPYLNVEKEYDKGFYTNEHCIGCGICQRICPTQNISFTENHPIWNHKCHGCMACVAYCPTKAVQFKTPEAYKQLGTNISKRLCLPDKRQRYHNPFVNANDLMDNRKIIP